MPGRSHSLLCFKKKDEARGDERSNTSEEDKNEDITTNALCFLTNFKIYSNELQRPKTIPSRNLHKFMLNASTRTFHRFMFLQYL